MGMDFIGPFEKSAYRNTHIYNLIDYFFKHMYPHSSPSTGGNNIISLFDHYLRFNLKPYVVYMDASTYFISQKLRTYFQKEDIMIVFAPFVSHKSVSLIEKLNNIL